ncbi:MAG: hypothetical protein HN732_03225 [Rhodospirillaceae bacterium]|nr:hypothetical protein [Rhodospirillaceae bacterium]
MAILLIDAFSFPPSLQIAIFIGGFTTLALIVLLLVGHFRPKILSWSETTLQDLLGGSGDEGGTQSAGESATPWPAVIKSMAYAVGFLLLSFVVGLFVAPPVFVATYLIFEAKMRPWVAILVGIVITALLDTGMILVHVDVWPGAIPEIVEGYLGGAIVPPI